MKIHPSGRAGFTVIEIMIAVGIIGLMAEIAVPNYIQAKKNSNRGTCIETLRQIDRAKQQWALEELRAANATPTLDNISPYIGNGDANPPLYCPTDTTKSFDNSYDPGDLLTTPECKLQPSHILE